MDSNTQRKLRRMALAGRWEDVRTCLTNCLLDNPLDTEAKEELRRLDNGQPMRLTMSAAERREAAIKDAQKALEWLMDDHPGEQIRLLNKDELAQILEAFIQHSSVLKKYGVVLSAETALYQRSIKHRLREFSGRITKRVLLRTVGAVGTLIVFGSIWYTLNINAHARYQELLKAVETPSYDNLVIAMREANGSINRFFCPEITDATHRAERWIANTEKQFNAIDAQLSLLETGKKKLASLTPTEIAQIENDIDTARRGHEQLRKRWQDICLRQYNELVAHKAKIQRELEEPLPTMPEMTGDMAADALQLSAYKDILSDRLSATEATVKLYGIVSDIPSAIRAAIDKTQQLQKEIKHLQQVLNRLSACKSYVSYQKALNDFEVSRYTPAKTLETIKGILPGADDFNLHAAAPGGGITGELLTTAADIYIKAAPSFPPAFPPSYEALQIPEDLFTAPSYQYKVYTLKLSEQETWYSTIQPQLDKTNFITYRRSTIDPAFNPEDTYREFQNDDTYKLGEIDATDLLLSLKIDRNTFFIRKNIPDLLTAVLNYPQGKHPALAQAYIYWVLLKLTDAHPYPLLSGIRFSPTLKAHTASFVEVMKRQRIDLKPGCWLSTAPEVRRAEQAFADWFSRHRGHDYRVEMAANFTKAYSTTARFCGYINEKGEIKLCRAIQMDAPLWYVTEDGIKQADSQTPPQDAVLLSPLFTAERTKP